jgi:hypothetical protein
MSHTHAVESGSLGVEGKRKGCGPMSRSGEAGNVVATKAPLMTWDPTVLLKVVRRSTLNLGLHHPI